MHFDLQMYQEDDLVLGTGQLSADQSGLAVNATGSVAGDRPTIFISLIDGEPGIPAQALCIGSLSCRRI